MGLRFLIEADGSMNRDVYRPLYEAGTDIVVLGLPALWSKDQNIGIAWDMMMKDVEQSIGDV